MSNRKTIQTKNEIGTFTTVSYKVLRDTRLSTTARILLIEILSDSDKLTFSPTLYQNRIGVTKKTLYKAISDLEDCGYIRRKDIAKPSKSGKVKTIYHYLISPYANLNKENKVEIPGVEQPKVEQTQSKVEEPKVEEKELNPEKKIKLEIKKRIDDVLEAKPFNGGNKEIRQGYTNRMYKWAYTYILDNSGEFPNDNQIRSKRLQHQSTINADKMRGMDQKYLN